MRPQLVENVRILPEIKHFVLVLHDINPRIDLFEIRLFFCHKSPLWAKVYPVFVRVYAHFTNRPLWGHTKPLVLIRHFKVFVKHLRRLSTCGRYAPRFGLFADRVVQTARLYQQIRPFGRRYVLAFWLRAYAGGFWL